MTEKYNQEFDTKSYNDKANCRLFFMHDKLSPKGDSENTKKIFQTIARLDHGGGKNAARDGSDGIGMEINIQWNNISERYFKGKPIPENAIQLHTNHLWTTGTQEEQELFYKVQSLTKQAYEKFGFSLWGEYDRDKDLNYHKNAKKKDHCYVIEKPEDIANGDEAALNERLYDAGAYLRKLFEKNKISIPQANIVSASQTTEVFKATCLITDLHKLFPELQDAKINYCLIHIRYATGVTPTDDSCHPHKGIAGLVSEIYNGESTNFKSAGAKNTLRARKRGDDVVLVLNGLTDTAQQSASGEYELIKQGKTPSEISVIVLSQNQNDPTLDSETVANLEVNSLTHEPWNGPSNMIFIANRQLRERKDPLEKRPMHYVDSDRYFVLCSEPGAFPVDEKTIKKHGRVRKTIGYDLQTGEVKFAKDILREANEAGLKRNGKTYAEISAEQITVMPKNDFSKMDPADHETTSREIIKKMNFFGVTEEGRRMFIFHPARTGSYQNVQMNYDAAIQALRENEHLNFWNSISLDHSQIFRPAISSKLYPNQIDTSAYIGVPGKTKLYKFENDLLFPGQMDEVIDKINTDTPGSAEKFKIIFNNNESIAKGLERLSNEIIEKVKSGKLTHICLSDKFDFTENEYAVNPAIAASHIFKRLMENGLTEDCCMMVQSGQVYEAHHIKVLSRLGNCCAVDAYLIPNILSNGIDTTAFLKNYSVNIVDEANLTKIENDYNKSHPKKSQKVKIAINEGESEEQALNRIAEEVIEKASNRNTSHIVLTDKYEFTENQTAIDPVKLINLLDVKLAEAELHPRLAIQSRQIFAKEHIEAISSCKLVHDVDAYSTAFMDNLSLQDSLKNYYGEVKTGLKGYDGLACISNAISGKGSRLAYAQGVDMKDPFFADIFGPYQVRDKDGSMIQLSDALYSDIDGKGITNYEEAAKHSASETFSRDKSPLKRRLVHIGEREMKQGEGVAHTMSAQVVEAVQEYVETNINNSNIFKLKNNKKPFNELRFKDKMETGFSEEDFRQLTVEEINSWTTSPQWKKCEEAIRQLHTDQPTRFIDLMDLKAKTDKNDKETGPISREEAGTVSEVLNTIFGGNASLPALTPAAHKAIRMGMRMVGRVIGTGEGGFSEGDLYERDTAPNDLQIGSAMFGVTPLYVSFAMMGAEIDEKEGQGAKAFGGKQVADKMTPEFAFLRKTVPGVELNSPFHKVFQNSIEDKNPYFVAIRPDLDIPATIKISPSADVVSMVLGAAKFLSYPGPAANGKCGTVNIASKDGGTAASDSNSATHTILYNARPAKESRLALDSSGFHEFINLRGSGLYHSAHDIISSRQLGNDQSEMMTFLMNLVGCIHIRQCDKAKERGCTVGVSNNEEAFRGDFMNVAKAMLDISSQILDKCAEKGWKFSELLGNPKSIELRHDIEKKYPGINTEWLFKESEKKLLTSEEKARTTRMKLIDDDYIKAVKTALNKGEKLHIKDIPASHNDFAFGTRIMHEINKVTIANNLQAFEDVKKAEKEFFKFKFDEKQQQWWDQKYSEKYKDLEDEAKDLFNKDGKLNVREMRTYISSKEFEIRSKIIEEFEQRFPAMVEQREKLWDNLIKAHDKLTEVKKHIPEDSYVFDITAYADKGQKTGFGAVGHYFGAFLTHGMTVNITGNAGDVLGFGMGAGSVLTCKPKDTELGATIGKHACAHATGGKAFLAQPIDAEVCARASGVTAVCEGIGNYSLHFATDCFVLDMGIDPKKIESGVYGPDMVKEPVELGTNMSGGFYIKYDPKKTLNRQINKDFLNVQTLEQRSEFSDRVISMLKEHVERTNSPWGKERLEALLNNPEQEIKNYSVAVPKQLEHMKVQHLYDYEEVLTRREMEDGTPFAGMEYVAAQLKERGLVTQTAANERFKPENKNKFAMAR